MINTDTNESSHSDLVQSPVVNPEKGTYNLVTPSTPETSLRPNPFLTPTSQNSSAPTGDNTIFASPNDSEITTLQCSPVFDDTTDEIFESINDDNNEEDEESDSDSADEEETEEIPTNSNGWKISDTKYHRIKVSVNSADMDMKDELKKSVKYLLRELKNKKAGMHFSTSIPPCPQSMNLAAYANETFFSTILKLINSNEKDIEPKTTMEDMEYFVRALLIAAVYGKSPSALISRPDYFPKFDQAINNIGGIQKFRHIICCLRSPKKHLGSTWDNYFDECQFVRDLERSLSLNSSDMINHKSIRNLTIDDDKLRFRSKLWKSYGFSQRKGIKSFGAVLNMACQAPTGIVCSLSLSGYKENINDLGDILLQRFCRVETKDTINMNGGIINGDRGYQFDVENYNCHQFNTVKRSSTLPFTFGNYRSQTNNQQVINENGCETMYHASKKIGKRTKELIAYRSGTGKVVMLSSTKKEHKGSRYTIVIRKNSDAKSFRSDNIDIDLERDDILTTLGVRELTQEQGSPEWFALRRFVITSTVAVKVLRLMLRRPEFILEVDEIALLTDMLGMMIVPEGEGLSDDLLAYQNSSFDELNKMTVSVLTPIAKAYGHTTSGKKKKEIIDAIISGPKIRSQQYENVLDMIMQCWFMKPLPKIEAFKIGSTNETSILEAVKEIASLDDNISVHMNSMKMGLVQCLTHSYLCTSVDGLIQLKIDGVLENVPLEFKTFSSYDSWNNALATAADIGKFQRCVFGNNLFKRAVGNVGYRAQLLHHTLVMRAEKILYVVAGRNEVAYMTLVSVPEDVIKRYFGILDKFAIRYLKWTFLGSTDPFPKDKLSDCGLALGNHDVNIHTVQLHFLSGKSYT